MPSVYNTSRTATSRSGLVGTASSPVSSTARTAEFWNREQSHLFEQWRSSFQQYEDSFASPYFDYFYTGQDISIKIEGVDETLPIYTFGYVIEQQKQPVYGFWDYTYSAMLRGTRIVTGAFTLVTTVPNLLTRKIAQASRNRARGIRTGPNAVRYSVRGLSADEANINQFWYRHYDSNLDANQQHLFSIHPPFNMVMKYGLQETSVVSNNPAYRVAEMRQKFLGNTAMATDINERLVVNPSVEEDMQILIENVELVNMSTEVNTDGDPILETYAFMARDMRLLSDAVYENPRVLPDRSSGGGGTASRPI